MTPTAGYKVLQLLMAAAIFKATAAVVLPVAKVPGGALLQPFVPTLPAVTILQAKLVAVPPSARPVAGLPGVVSVIVTAPPFTDAVTPTAGYETLQLLMAAARYEAIVAGVEFGLMAPAVELVHAFAPLGIAPAVAVNVNAPWVEVVRNGALLPEMLINESSPVLVGVVVVVTVAVTLGFGAVIYE